MFYYKHTRVILFGIIMIILGLGYITVKSDKLDDWTEFSNHYLGMQLVDKTKSTAILRLDERKQRFVITNETAASNILDGRF